MNYNALRLPGRRDLFRSVALGLAARIARAQAPKIPDPQILRAEFGEPIQVPNSHGDTWTTTWGDDDQLYSVSDDSTGFGKVTNSNLALNRIGGNPPDLVGKTINPMAEYGRQGQFDNADGAMWKACGLTCVDGVLYMAVSRHSFPVTKPWAIQQTWDATIIKSTDHGETWSAKPEYDHAMFPGRLFSTPFFVQYGKNGEGTKDGADQYVYAISNDGTWNNGNFMTLGRVPRDRIGRLQASDWEFVHGFKNGQPVWRPRHDNALYVFRSPNRTSMAGVHYIAPLDTYIMPQWHYPEAPFTSQRWKATRFELYQAPAPWGPWTLFHVQHFEPQAFYNPSIPAKFISLDGRKLWLFTAGYFAGGSTPKYYCLNLIPVTIKPATDKWDYIEKVTLSGPV